MGYYHESGSSFRKLKIFFYTLFTVNFFNFVRAISRLWWKFIKEFVEIYVFINTCKELVSGRRLHFTYYKLRNFVLKIGFKHGPAVLSRFIYTTQCRFRDLYIYIKYSATFRYILRFVSNLLRILSLGNRI